MGRVTDFRKEMFYLGFDESIISNHDMISIIKCSIKCGVTPEDIVITLNGFDNFNKTNDETNTKRH